MLGEDDTHSVGQECVGMECAQLLTLSRELSLEELPV